MARKRYPRFDEKYGTTYTTYEFTGAIKEAKQPKFRYLEEAIIWGVKHRDNSGEPIRIISHTGQYRNGEFVEISKPYVAGQILFTGERYLPHLVENGPMLAIWHDRLQTYSKEILIYPKNHVSMGFYLRKFEREIYLPKNRKL